MKRNTMIVLGVLAAVVAAAVAGWAIREGLGGSSATDKAGASDQGKTIVEAVREWLSGGSATDRAMTEMRAQPLVGLVLADNPAIEAELRRAVEEDQRQPQAGPSRAFLVIGGLRKTIIGPTVAAADDPTALAVMKARAELVGYLQKNDVVACRQFANEGIHDISKLDSEGQRLFRATLAAMEAAYRNGKANGGKGTPPSYQEFTGLLQSAGFTPADFAKFSQAATLKDDDFCALELRIDDAPGRLPDDKRGAFARFVIAH